MSTFIPVVVRSDTMPSLFRGMETTENTAFESLIAEKMFALDEHCDDADLPQLRRAAIAALLETTDGDTPLKDYLLGDAESLPNLEVLGLFQTLVEAQSALLVWHADHLRPTLTATDQAATEQLGHDWKGYMKFQDALRELPAETNLIAEEGCNWFMIIKEWG